MTPREAVQLTGYIQAHFPSQPINEFTPDALGELLAEYPMADCRMAVLTISKRASGDRTQWCSPSDVAAEVKRIRSKRIADHPPLTPPPELADDTAGQIEWRADANRRIADGELIDCDQAYGELKPRVLSDLRALMPAPTVGRPTATNPAADVARAAIAEETNHA